jgi:hypothetical protein
VLPQHEAHSSYSEGGTNGHALLCGVVNRVPGAAAKLEQEIPGLHEKIAVEMDGVSDATGEDAYCVDLETRTSIYLGRNIDRKYEQALGRRLNAFEICTSLDVKGRKDGRIWVRDFKFGITSSWWQLYIQAMALLWLPGFEQEGEVDGGFIFIEDRDDYITVTNDTATLYMVDLDARADELMDAFRTAERIEAELEQGLISQSTVKTVEGKWCTYCGAFPHCPSKWKLAKSMLSLDIVDHIGALTLEQCGDAWLKLAEIKKNIVKKTEDALKERMRAEGGFPLPDGKILKVMPMPGRLGFDKEGAVELLRQLGADRDQISQFVKRGEGYDQVRKVGRKE